jgi:hypothetical protein
MQCNHCSEPSAVEFQDGHFVARFCAACHAEEERDLRREIDCWAGAWHEEEAGREPMLSPARDTRALDWEVI